MNVIKLIIKGIFIGIGKIIPGVSGGVLAISLGVYEKSIYALNNIFKDFKNSFKFLTPLATGIFISLVFMCDIVVKLLDNFYFPTILLFVGLIGASLSEIKIKKDNKHFLITLICFFLVSLIGVISGNNYVSFDSNISKVLFFILIGIIDSVTMIIPGISGTAVLMMIGCYKMLLESFTLFIHFDFSFNNFLIILPFVIGMIIGSVVTLKIVNVLFEKYNEKMYAGILGFSYATLFIMLKNALNSSYSFSEFILGFILLLSSYGILKKLTRG